MQKITFDSSLINYSITMQYKQRPRIDKMLMNAAQGRLVYIVAGAGYGKTQAVHKYIEQQPDAVVRWVQLSDGDNLCSHYWERIAHAVSKDNGVMAAQMRQLGFPDTPARFKQFKDILRDTEHKHRKVFIVLDDFHLIHSKDILNFTERCINAQTPNLCVFILSQNEPEINIVSLLSKGAASLITEDMLRFTKAEAEDFFIQCAVPICTTELLQLMEVTKGWALALNMLATNLMKTPNNLQYALGAMRQSVFKFLETDVWRDFPQKVQKAIVKLSLLAELPVAPLQSFAEEWDALKSTPGLTSFIWHSSLTNDIKINPIYLEFVQSKLDTLTWEEKQQTYAKAATWCAENGFFMDAIGYYAKLRQFASITKTFFSYPFKLPLDVSEYFLELLQNLNPDSREEKDPQFLFLTNYFIPLLLVGAGRYEEAERRCNDIVKTWETVDTPLANILLYMTYSNLTYIDMYNCTLTHSYLAPMHLEKSVDYFKRSVLPATDVATAFINADIRSFACLVGAGAPFAKLDEFLEATRQTERLIEETRHSVYAGYEDLLICEYAFFKNQPDTARNHAHKAIAKANAKKQYSIALLAEKYLLRIAAQQGDHLLVKEALKQMHSYLDIPDFSSRQLYYDLYTGAFYALVGLPQLVPRWIITDEKELYPGIKIPSRELYASALYYITAKQYHQALAILCASYPRPPRERLLFGEVRILLLTAVAHIRTGDGASAMASFEKAYHLSFDGVLEMFFVELGRELHPLASMAESETNIPKTWLQTIDRKASIYAKKTAMVTTALKAEMGIKEMVALSTREKEVLNDLYQGLSRDEIAENRFLSVNTVKKTLQSIYVKLDAGNSVDAVRIALENNLIKH